MLVGVDKKYKGETHVWLTPPEIITSLGEFDLDPCSPIKRPWDTAKRHFTEKDDGLLQKWEGRVWMNPPYDRDVIDKWLLKMAQHMNGTTMIFGRTDTRAFQDLVFPFAESILFMKGRVHFYNEKGERSKTGAGAPSVLISYSEYDADMLDQSGIEGKHLLINSVPVITIKNSPSWRSVVSISLIRLNGKAKLQDIYDAVEVVASDKIERNKNFKAKVRQVLQKKFKRVGKAQYSLK